MTSRFISDLELTDMQDSTSMFLQILSAFGAVATPIVVVIIGWIVSRNLKRLENQQWRNQELIKVRLGYYQELAPSLNDLFCYFTFVGNWKQLSPVDVVSLKRQLDRTLYSAAPLFNSKVIEAYDAFTKLCFQTFNRWGDDAKLRTGFYHRREHFPGQWMPEWDRYFDRKIDDSVTAVELEAVRAAYTAILAALVGDMDLTRSRTDYASAAVAANADVWRRTPMEDVRGKP